MIKILKLFALSGLLALVPFVAAADQLDLRMDLSRSPLQLSLCL